MKKYFDIDVIKYDKKKSFHVYRPASLTLPKDNSVMFITERHLDKAESLYKCANCLVFWPENADIPLHISTTHCVVRCVNPRKEYCLFFRENNITYYPPLEKYQIRNGAYISEKAIIGRNCTILPGVYISGECEIGNDCYIGAGVKLVGEVHIGNNVVIRENSVIGADGLSTNRDDNGKTLTMPQFGGVIIEDGVQIGALTVIARGAIDNTVIRRGSKIDSSSFISHNVQIGEDSLIVGETIMFGSSSTGKQVLISGNSTIRDGRRIGNGTVVGMGSVVVNSVEDNQIVKGNPAR